MYIYRSLMARYGKQLFCSRRTLNREQRTITIITQHENLIFDLSLRELNKKANLKEISSHSYAKLLYIVITLVRYNSVSPAKLNHDVCEMF